MILTIENGLFTAVTIYDERHHPKGANFRWTGTEWVTDDPIKAAELIEYADELALEAILTSGVDVDKKVVKRIRAQQRKKSSEEKRISNLDAIFDEIFSTGEYPFNDAVTHQPDREPKPVKPTKPHKSTEMAKYHRELEKYKEELTSWKKQPVPEPYTFQPKFRLKGEEISINQRDSCGGGHWLVITGRHVWAVRNNGSDGDDWAYNNVFTVGAGAIGKRVKKTADLVKRISALKK